MKISVLMPVYNTPEDFLRDAIESILNQTYKDFEFVIVNDGSTNNAEEVIFSYKDSRIKYIKNEQNMGLIKTLNRGLDNATGEYVARFDSDDISLPNRLEIQAKFLDKNPQVGVVGSRYESFPKKRISDELTDSKLIKESLLVVSNQIGHPTVMFRKNILDENNIRYDEKALYVEDYKIWLDLIDKTEFSNIEEILLKYRRHGGSICSKNTIRQNINAQKIMFQAQSKFFNVKVNDVISILENLFDDKNIDINDLKTILEFVNKIKFAMKNQSFSIEYKLNHQFAKFALKKCKKSFAYYKARLGGELKPFFEK